MSKPKKEQKASKDNVTEQNGDGAQTPKKKRGLYKLLKNKVSKCLSPKAPNVSPASTDGKEEEHEEITADHIQEHILQKRFGKASQDLIVLEHEIYNQTDDKINDESTQELESLYVKLEDAVFEVIKDSIREDNQDLLKEAVQAIVEQETEDIRCSSESNSTQVNILRPLKWKQKWLDYVKLSVSEQVKNLPGISPRDSNSSFSQNFISLGKTIKTDLIHVVKHLKVHYPPQFDVCNIYAQYYHSLLKTQVESITEFELTGKDTHLVLCWVHNIYPNNILRDSALEKHIDESKLESLLPFHKIRELESSYKPYEVDSVKEWMTTSLNFEIQRWKEGIEPSKLGGRYHSELPIDIIHIYKGGLQRAADITPKMSRSIAPLLGDVLVDFLKSYKNSFEEYKEKNRSDEHFKTIIIANINCCRSFRGFVDRSDTELTLISEEKVNSILNDFEELGFDTLLQDLFQELKVHFKKISQGNGLCSHQTMLEIIKIAERHISPLKTLTPSCYKVAIDIVHLHLVKEYTTRLLKKKVSHKNLRQLQALASQIHENATLINDFFSFHESQAAWLNSVIPKLAEIIRLQDLSAIQLEVATLAEDFPDIGKKHIEAILYIKANLSRSDVKSILSVINFNERRESSNAPFFSLIKPA
ncbi:tumor necrosis factor alpha-induced protein 2-like [Pelodytes ibericus]